MSELPYAKIAAQGPDVFEFLQNQLAADLRGYDAGETRLSAWCNPKGRVICLLRVRAADGGFALLLPAELGDEVLRRLSTFRFRAKVELGSAPASAEDLGLSEPLDEWRLANLRAGVVEIGAAQSEAFTPHMLNLDLLGAVSLEKGCYPGQEIVARTHYRGATKRRCLRFESRDPVSPGAKVSDGTRDVGEVVNAIGTDLLAVVPIDKAEAELTAAGTSLKHQPLPYL